MSLTVAVTVPDWTTVLLVLVGACLCTATLALSLSLAVAAGRADRAIGEKGVKP